MRKNTLFRRFASGALVFAVVAGGGLLSAGAVHAQGAPPNPGTLTFTPATGTNLSLITATTSSGCPSGTRLGRGAGVTGPNGFNFLITVTTPDNIREPDPADPIAATFNQTLQDTSVLQTPPVPLVAGTYTVTLSCVDFFEFPVGTRYTGELIFTSPTEYRTDAPTPTPFPVIRDTVTTLTTSPASPVVAGTAVTLNARIEVLPFPDFDGKLLTGTVQFRDGDTSIGNPVPVTDRTTVSGTARTTTSALAVGSHQLTAEFIPANPPANPMAFRPSTSLPVTFVVNATGARGTTITLSVFPAGPFPVGIPRLLLARVAPDAAAGTVQFLERDRRLGTPVRVREGSAFLVTDRAGGPRLSAGVHRLTAVFTPDDPAAFGPSTSSVVVEVTRRIP